MEDLDQALMDIKALRGQLARGTEFHGYGPATVALTGLFAIGAAVAQPWIVPAPALHPVAWLMLWAGVAVVSVALIGAEVVFRTRRAHAGLEDEMVQEAVLQLLPSAGAGVLLAAVLWRYAPAALWMLPGLWQILLSLGVFAACRNLPAPMILVAFWYLCSGILCLAFAQGPAALLPWAMGAPFAAGEALAAALLWAAMRGRVND